MPPHLCCSIEKVLVKEMGYSQRMFVHLCFSPRLPCTKILSSAVLLYYSVVMSPGRALPQALFSTWMQQLRSPKEREGKTDQDWFFWKVCSKYHGRYWRRSQILHLCDMLLFDAKDTLNIFIWQVTFFFWAPNLGWPSVVIPNRRREEFPQLGPQSFLVRLCHVETQRIFWWGS